MTGFLRVLVAIYNFIAGDIVILIGSSIAFVIVAVMSHGAGLTGIAAGVALFAFVGATLVATLLREKTAGGKSPPAPDQST